MRPRRATAASVLLIALTVVAGCASVPENSPVQILRQVGGDDDAAPPPGPVDGSNPTDLVRDFVNDSASSTDKHSAARRFLAPEAAAWKDSSSLTLLEGPIATVPVLTPSSASPDVQTVRIRGTEIGYITPMGSFEPKAATFQLDVGVVHRDGQWRISRLPDGVVVQLAAFRNNYRAVRTYFTDPARQMVVADLRYVPNVPGGAQAARAMDLLRAGPSSALLNAVGTQLRAPRAALRSNVAMSDDGALVVDLTGLGDLDDTGKRLLAAQVVLTLSDVNIPRVRLLIDGEPLLAGKLDWTRDDVLSFSEEQSPTADVAALVANGGRVGQLAGALLPVRSATAPTTPNPRPRRWTGGGWPS